MTGSVRTREPTGPVSDGGAYWTQDRPGGPRAHLVIPMELTLTLNMDNAAFTDAPGVECSRILRQLAGDIEQPDADHAFAGRKFHLRDLCGNRVGVAQIVA